MPHLAIREGLPGIQGLFDYNPETARPLRDLAEVVLRRSEVFPPGSASSLPPMFPR